MIRLTYLSSIEQVRKVRRSLKSLREQNDVRGVLGVLEVCVRHNFAGTESARLYSETFYGTKDSIEGMISQHFVHVITYF